MTGLPPPIRPTSVSGGDGGVSARYDDILSEAAILDSEGSRLVGLAVHLQPMLADPEVALAAVLDPGGAARFESDLALALDGFSGLLAVAAGIQLIAEKDRLATYVYRDVDAFLANLERGSEFAIGFVAGVTAPVWLPIVAAGGVVLHYTDPSLGGDAEAFLAEHPGFTEALVNVSPGLLDGVQFDISAIDPIFRPIFLTNPESGAALLARLYPDGKPEVTRVDGNSFEARNFYREPHTLSDLFTNVNRCESIDNQSPNGACNVVVQKLTTLNAEGKPETAWVVYLPGTSNWDLSPGMHGTITDGGTNFRSLANETTSYEIGVEKAIQAAGIPEGQPIMLVGHSQGGMIAVQAASKLSSSGYNVTDVVTAGSPVATMNIPSKVQVLSLQNNDDIVPRLAGTSNPDTLNHVTVTFDHQTGSIGGNHSLEYSYVPGAEGAWNSQAPSIAAWKSQASIFFHATSSSSQLYSITRKP